MLVTKNSASSWTSSLRRKSNNSSRGAFIVLEGVDRCGKTTQSALLLKHFIQTLGMAAVAMRFPDRTTCVGTLIDQYLKSNQELDDRAIHLLFSANRWELAPTLTGHLESGTSVVCDRYAYSGVAFSSSKDSLSNDFAWCQACDVGLPAPDAVIFLDLSPDVAEQRGGYGGERYEKQEMQIRVRQRFAQLQAQDEREGKVPWHVVNAAQSIDQVQKEIADIVNATVARIVRNPSQEEEEDPNENGETLTPIPLLWQSLKHDNNKEN